MSAIILNKKPKPSKKKRIETRPINDPKGVEKDAKRTLKRITKHIQQDLDLALDTLDNKTPAEVGAELEAIRKKHNFSLSYMAHEIARRWVEKVNLYNKKETMKVIRSALGIDIATIVDEALQYDLESLIYENASYISSIPDYLIGNVARRVLQNFRGEPMPEGRTLRQQIKEEFKVSDERAKVLARDQTAKMNTSLTQVRQKQLGIEWYVWKTVEDQRVVGNPNGKYPKGNAGHKNHYIMQDLVCKWDDPDVYSDDYGKTWKQRTQEMPHNAPGQDIMCRCRAAPFIDVEALKVKWE